MTPPNDPQKIVELQQRQAKDAAAGDRVGDLLKLVRGIAQKRIHALVSTLFENVDDALFDLAEKAESNAVQTQFFDGMREVRKKRQLVERVFQDQLAKIFADFAAGKLKPARPEVSPQGSGGLSLVDDRELEESLAVSSMVAKAENRLARALYQVNLRLSVISGGNKVEDATNPIGPAPLGSAFRQAVREFELNVNVKLIIYKLFDRYVMAGLDALYDEVNAELVRAGVLPQVRYHAPGAHPIAPGAMAMRGGMAPGMPGSSGGSEGGYTQSQLYDPAAAELQAELYNTVRALLAGRRGAAGYVGDGGDYAGGAGGPAPPTLSPTDLLSALTLLQNQTFVAQSQASSVADAAQAVQQIKQELLEQVNRLGGDTRHNHVSAADEDTIDLVGMLFEFILQDRNLPAQIGAQLGRLQIPYLKVAILDKHLFAQKSHPARQLLDELAQVGIGWSEEADRDHRLYDRIKQSVETILKEFDDDVGVFERELTGFGGFMEQFRKRADLAEQRAAEATRGREKLHAARRSAAREILKRIDDRELPPLVHNVLSRPWANYLVLTALRQGEQSEDWKNALRFADEFIWSALPKDSAIDKARLRALLPNLEKALRHGLATVAYHENDVRVLMQQLSEFYQRLLSGDAVEVKPAREVIAENAAHDASSTAAAGGAETPPETQATAVQSPVEEIVLSSGSVEPEPAEANFPDDDECLKTVREMKVGTWLEFTDEQGNRERAKLSWISPISSKYLFVNRRGLKVCDKTVAALTVELRRGTAIILEEVPLFDRALDAIVERLRQNQPAGAGKAEAAKPPVVGQPGTS